MTKPLSFFGVLLVAHLLCSCGSGPGGKDNPSIPNPKTPEEAINSLSQKHRDAFESWKTRLLKSCDGSDAFGVGQSDRAEVGLDLPVLFKKNSRSLVIADGNEVALLGVPNAFDGVSSSKVEETEEINGKSYKLQAELKREGFKCTVVLYGQKVVETDVAQNMDLIGYWSTDNDPKLVYRKTTREQFGAAAYSEVKNHGLVDAFASAGLPSQKAFRIIGNRFGISDDKVSGLFRLVPNALFTEASAILPGESSTVWLNGEYSRWILSTDTAKRLLDAAPQTLDLEWRVRIPQVGSGDLKNDADAGTLRFNSTIRISKKAETGDYGFIVSQLKYQGLKPYDVAEASQCVSLRTRLFKLLDIDPLGLQVHPGLSEAIAPCRPFSTDTDGLVASNGTIKTLIPEIFRGVSATKNTRYSGWQEAISKLSMDYLEKGLDVGKELDPQGTSPIIRSLSGNLSLLKVELQKSTNLTPAKQLIYQMGIDWALTGQSVDQNKIARILAAADNAYSPFKVSTENLLRDLSRDPNGSEAAISFGVAIDSTYKAEANRALALATSLDYQDWEQNYFSQVLQKQVPIDDLKKWSERLGRIQTELAKYPAVQKIRGNLARLTIKWLDSGEATLGDIGRVYGSLSNSFDPFEESTNQLVRDLGESLSKNKEALDFASALSTDYNRIAVSVRDKATSIGFEDWGKSFFQSVIQKRPNLDQISKWESTLVAATDFTQREHTRMQGESEFFNEGYRKDIIGTALKEVWDKDDFSQMEQIAELGKFKLTCDRYKGVSSIVNCAGMSFFSRGAKKFFDPAFNRRYGPLSKEFASYMGQLRPEQEYFSMRSSMMSGFFGSFDPIWSSCAGSAYDAKATALRSQIPAYVRESDQFKKWDLERAIRQTLENCN